MRAGSVPAPASSSGRVLAPITANTTVATSSTTKAASGIGWLPSWAAAHSNTKSATAGMANAARSTGGGPRA